jgi:hypothetical protein
MKTMKLFKTVTLVIIFATALFAKVWTVDNKSGSVADFTQIYSAAAAVESGDTIYVHSSNGVYGYTQLDKKLYIFGPGYFLSENSGLQADPRPAVTNGFQFNAGSAGSVVSGFEIRSTGYEYYNINILTDSIYIKRNKITSDNMSAMIYIESGYSNIVISGNYLYDSKANRILFTIKTNCNNIRINNNYFEDDTDCIVVQGSSSVEAWNNIFNGNVTMSNSVFYNNILMNGSFSGTNNVEDIHHNLGDADLFNTNYNNQNNIVMTTVFVDSGSVSTDGDWQLRSGSPAIGAGLDGVDCGMFGGSTPYVLSGIPAIPSIYYFIAPGSASGTEGLQVEIKARANK